MKWALLLLTLGAAGVVSAREAKWFLPRPTVTRYIHEQRQITDLVTSSCVVLENSLKPCRHLRHIHPTAPSYAPKILMTATPRLQDLGAPILSTTQEEPVSVRSWSSYLGLDPVVVLHTVTHLVTARTISPAAVVTFSVRGCQPSHLPFGLPLCSENNSTFARISSTKDVHFTED